MSVVSIKFGSSKEEQKQAESMIREMVRGQEEREQGKVLYVDKKGKPVYRILLGGLRWVSDGKGLGCYRAADGVIGTAKIGSARCTTYREWAVGKGPKNQWGVVLHDGRKGSPHVIAENVKTFGQAKNIAEHHARRMPWIEGAPW